MNKTTHPNTVYPQTVEIPEPLEIHPSVPADLAEDLLRIADLFAHEPNRYVGHSPYLNKGCGCICAHLYAERVAVCSWDVGDKWPSKATALARIYHEASMNESPQWAIARISHFLSTGQ